MDDRKKLMNYCSLSLILSICFDSYLKNNFWKPTFFLVRQVVFLNVHFPCYNTIPPFLCFLIGLAQFKVENSIFTVVEFLGILANFYLLIS